MENEGKVFDKISDDKNMDVIQITKGFVRRKDDGDGDGVGNGVGGEKETYIIQMKIIQFYEPTCFSLCVIPDLKYYSNKRVDNPYDWVQIGFGIRFKKNFVRKNKNRNKKTKKSKRFLNEKDSFKWRFINAFGEKGKSNNSILLKNSKGFCKDDIISVIFNFQKGFFYCFLNEDLVIGKNNNGNKFLKNFGKVSSFYTKNEKELFVTLFLRNKAKIQLLKCEEIINIEDVEEEKRARKFIKNSLRK